MFCVEFLKIRVLIFSFSFLCVIITLWAYLSLLAYPTERIEIMKIVVVSDSHKEFHKLNSVVENNLDADAFIHLGDGEHEFSSRKELFIRKRQL